MTLSIFSWTHCSDPLADLQAAQSFLENPRLVVTGRNLSGVMPLSIHLVVWLLRPFHCHCYSIILATVGGDLQWLRGIQLTFTVCSSFGAGCHWPADVGGVMQRGKRDTVAPSHNPAFSFH